MSVTNCLRCDRSRQLPDYVGVQPVNHSGSSYLGNASGPFPVSADPKADSFSVSNIGTVSEAAATRLQEKIGLRQQLDHLKPKQITQQPWTHSMNLLTGSAATRAFDISREDQATRNRWGQQLLLAKRLVESGVDLVTAQ